MIGTQFSDDRRYRYTLERQLSPTPGGTVLFVMLNPSTADEEKPDPTVTRCMNFGKSWGYSRLLVGNLFALRSPNPRDLLLDPSPVGIENDTWLMRLHTQADHTIVAWGAHALAVDRAQTVRRRVFDRLPYKALHCLGITKAEAPRHPLYLPGDLQPEPYKFPEVAR